MAKCVQCELLVKEIKRFQRKPYIILKHEGKVYKAYEVEQITSDESQPLVSPSMLSDWVSFEHGVWRRAGNAMEVKMSTTDQVPVGTSFGGHESDFYRPRGYDLELICGTTEDITHPPMIFLGVQVPERQERVVRATYRVAGWGG